MRQPDRTMHSLTERMENCIRSGWKIYKSLTKKLELIKNYDLGGVAEWKLGLEDDFMGSDCEIRS